VAARRLVIIAAVAVSLLAGGYVTAHLASENVDPTELRGPVPGDTTLPPDVADAPIPPASDHFAQQQVAAVRKLHCIQRAHGNAKKRARCDRLP
jgi:hypothetical protein